VTRSLRFSSSNRSSFELKSLSYWSSSKSKIVKVMGDEPRPATSSMRPGAKASRRRKLLEDSYRLFSGQMHRPKPDGMKKHEGSNDEGLSRIPSQR